MLGRLLEKNRARAFAWTALPAMEIARRAAEAVRCANLRNKTKRKNNEKKRYIVLLKKGRRLPSLYFSLFSISSGCIILTVKQGVFYEIR